MGVSELGGSMGRGALFVQQNAQHMLCLYADVAVLSRSKHRQVIVKSLGPVRRF